MAVGASVRWFYFNYYARNLLTHLITPFISRTVIVGGVATPMSSSEARRACCCFFGIIFAIFMAFFVAAMVVRFHSNRNQSLDMAQSETRLVQVRHTPTTTTVSR